MGFLDVVSAIEDKDIKLRDIRPTANVRAINLAVKIEILENEPVPIEQR